MMLSILPVINDPKLLWLSCILLVVGLVAIIKGGDWFVDAAVWMAEVLHMPKFLIGATIVSLATTLPEMIVSIIDTIDAVGVAALGGTPDFSIAVGNAVGSVTANTGLIFAISAIFISTTVDKKDFGFKGALILLSCAVLLGFSLFTGKFGLFGSAILMVVFFIYMWQTVKEAKKSSLQNTDEQTEEEAKKDGKTVAKNILLFIVGTLGIVLGADLLVENAKIVATAAGISEGIIGITLVAVGTSLPELITTITSIVKKEGELGIGNVIGANIIDLVLILPICSFISGGNLVVADQSRFLDMPALLAISLVGVIPTLITGKVKKWQGFAMLAMYIAYLVTAILVFNIA